MSNNAGTGVLGSPISQNIIMAGPATGADNFPSFRAQVISDLPTGIPTANMADPYSTDFLALRAMGSGIKGYLPGNIIYAITNQNVALTSGQGAYMAIYVPKPVTITGAYLFQATSGVYTANNFNGIALYSLNAGTGLLTQVAASTNNGSLWTGINKLTIPFSATYNAAVGVYFLALMWSASATTTAPKLNMTAPSPTIAAMDFPNSIKLQAYQNGTTALPASVASSVLTANYYVYYSFLY